MKYFLSIIIAVFIVNSAIANANQIKAKGIIIDHNCTNVFLIPKEFIKKAKQNLIVAYGHTSHGSQITSGMNGLDDFTSLNGLEKGLFSFNSKGTNSALKFFDTPFKGAQDLGNPDFESWESATRNYLGVNTEVNVVLWSWCGQLSWASVDDVNKYLRLMTGLEKDYSNVKFVYMTGHLDGGGTKGTLNTNNNIIREYCKENEKILYDFADIESFDPDGEVNFMELNANDNCDYVSINGEKNWAVEWQNTHVENVDWYNCSAAHSQALNGNRKAFAAWWLFARLAGWQNDSLDISSGLDQKSKEFMKSWFHNGCLFIQMPSEIIIKSVDVYNILGENVLRRNSNEVFYANNYLKIDLASLSLIYYNKLLFLQIESEKGKYYYKVLFK